MNEYECLYFVLMYFILLCWIYKLKNNHTVYTLHGKNIVCGCQYVSCIFKNKKDALKHMKKSNKLNKTPLWLQAHYVF